MCLHTGVQIEGGGTNKMFYYPLDPAVDPDNLPKRNNVRAAALRVVMLGTEEAKKEIGINGYSPLLDLPNMSLHFTVSPSNALLLLF